jgi:signal transduction histidine kinase
MTEMARVMRFRRRLTLAGIVLLLLMFAAFLLAYRSVQRAEEMNALVAHTQEILQETGNLRVDRARLRNNFLAFGNTRRLDFAKAFEANRTDIEQGLAHLRSLTANKVEQRRILGELTPALSKEIDAMQNALNKGTTWPAAGAAPAESLPLIVPSEDDARSLIDRFEANELALFRVRSLAVDHSAHRARSLLLLTGVLSILILLAAGHLIQREIMKRAKVEMGLRQAQEILGVRYGEQRVKLDRLVEDLHTQIRARNSAEEELQRLNDDLEIRVESRTAELQELNRELEAFTYSVSHDLRAPLRHMDGFSRILQQEFGPQLPDEAKHYLDRVRAASTHMSALVEDLLHLSRVGRQAPQRQFISLRTLAEEAREDILPEAQGREIQWKLDSLPEVEADPVLLRQVFANLFSNAVKFTRNQPLAVIEVSAREEKGKVVIFVKDNGAGFDPKYADKLFGVFQRLHRQDEFEGTGIGLATVQRIIHKHDGRVWAESQPGQGAIFFFTLPASEQIASPARDRIGAKA